MKMGIQDIGKMVNFEIALCKQYITISITQIQLT